MLFRSAGYAIFPLQDVLGYGSDARMNTPGTASGNWNWRFADGVLRSELAEKLKELTVLYGRHTIDEPEEDAAPANAENLAEEDTLSTEDAPDEEVTDAAVKQTGGIGR